MLKRATHGLALATLELLRTLEMPATASKSDVNKIPASYIWPTVAAPQDPLLRTWWNHSLTQTERNTFGFGVEERLMLDHWLANGVGYNLTKLNFVIRCYRGRIVHGTRQSCMNLMHEFKQVYEQEIME